MISLIRICQALTPSRRHGRSRAVSEYHFSGTGDPPATATATDTLLEPVLLVYEGHVDLWGLLYRQSPTRLPVTPDLRVTTTARYSVCTRRPRGPEKVACGYGRSSDRGSWYW